MNSLEKMISEKYDDGYRDYQVYFKRSILRRCFDESMFSFNFNGHKLIYLNDENVDKVLKEIDKTRNGKYTVVVRKRNISIPVFDKIMWGLKLEEVTARYLTLLNSKGKEVTGLEYVIYHPYIVFFKLGGYGAVTVVSAFDINKVSMNVKAFIVEEEI